MSPMRQADIDLSRVAAALGELGVAAASMSELARRAGVAKPTLYARYRSRHELLRACADTEAERLLDRLELASPADALADYAEQCPGWRLLLRADDPHAASARERIVARLRREAAASGPLDPLDAAHAFLAAATAMIGRPVARTSLRVLSQLLLDTDNHQSAEVND